MYKRGTTLVVVTLILIAGGCLGQGQQEGTESGVLLVSPANDVPQDVTPVKFKASPVSGSEEVKSSLKRAQENDGLVSVGINDSQVETFRSQLSALSESATKDNKHYLKYNSAIYVLELKLED